MRFLTNNKFIISNAFQLQRRHLQLIMNYINQTDLLKIVILSFL